MQRVHKQRPRQLGPTMVVARALVFLALLECPAIAQNSSLFREQLPAPPDATNTNSLENSSWTYQKLPPPREIQIRDIITIRVDEKAVTIAEGEMQQRKNSLYDAVLADWIHLVGLKAVKPDLQADGDQRVQGQLNQLFRSEAELETRESLVFDIAANVADILPNGNLVLEAHRVININEDSWQASLSGICHKDKVGPGLVVLSKDIADLRIDKKERGHVRDGYRRGWFQRWFERLQPF